MAKFANPAKPLRRSGVAACFLGSGPGGGGIRRSVLGFVWLKNRQSWKAMPAPNRAKAAVRAKITVSAMGWNIFPSTPVSARIGR